MGKVFGFRIEDILFYLLVLSFNFAIRDLNFVDIALMNKLSILTLLMAFLYFVKGRRG